MLDVTTKRTRPNGTRPGLIKKLVYLSPELVNRVAEEATYKRAYREDGEERVNHSRLIEDALREHFGMEPLERNR